ncbi:hypothetical protein PJF56_10700 [Roseofilum sp. BLCC_M91]|uniref:Uncharacterized protein n=1 Tax=Roseofilum halophilum BLCC-M91 TaxID=3022259 RepID=A0ABT7BM28_9CYAN|nr:hypothetical protein [Roseofilum halophilum]MDJ1179333.1 hypothetical protein [Roseofilum halophilum BLCC-M91]
MNTPSHAILNLTALGKTNFPEYNRHFFPFSNYRLISPFSYWNPAHYGVWVSAIEILLVIAGTIYCWSFIQSWFGKILMVLVNTAYVILWFLFYFRLIIS